MVLRIANNVAWLWRTKLLARALVLAHRAVPASRSRESGAQAVAEPVAERPQLFFTISNDGMNSNQCAMIPIPMLECNRLQNPMSIPVPLRMSVEVVVFSPSAEKQAASFTF